MAFRMKPFSAVVGSTVLLVLTVTSIYGLVFLV